MEGKENAVTTYGFLQVLDEKTASLATALIIQIPTAHNSAKRCVLRIEKAHRSEIGDHLMIEGVPVDVSKDELISCFNRFGSVVPKSVHFVPKRTGRRTACLRMFRHGMAKKAIRALHGKLLPIERHKNVKVSVSQCQSDEIASSMRPNTKDRWITSHIIDAYKTISPSNTFQNQNQFLPTSQSSHATFIASQPLLSNHLTATTTTTNQTPLVMHPIATTANQDHLVMHQSAGVITNQDHLVMHQSSINHQSTGTTTTNQDHLLMHPLQQQQPIKII